MTNKPKRNLSVDALNAAFAADPNAIHALLMNRVPCNRFLADDQFVQVGENGALPFGHFHVGALGLVNAVLAANGLPLVAAIFGDSPIDANHDPLLGFTEYSDPTPPAKLCRHGNDEDTCGRCLVAWQAKYGGA